MWQVNVSSEKGAINRSIEVDLFAPQGQILQMSMSKHPLYGV